jgi:hypothetical protein
MLEDLYDKRGGKKAKTSNVDFVNDGLSTQKIRDTVQEIRAYVCSNKDSMTHEDIVKNLQEQHSFFVKRYPMLFSMATNKNDFDFTNFEYFLNKRDDIINNVMTSEEASKQIGQEWFEKYVDVSKINKK